MRYYHRHSFFPLIIILLTLLLGAFMVLTLTREPDTSGQTGEVVLPVDAQAYREALLEVVSTFETDVALAIDPSTQLVVAQKAFSDVIALRVPPDKKDVHLSLALLFTRIHTTLKSAEPSIDALLLELSAIKQAL
jgi:hypothetical protein